MAQVEFHYSGISTIIQCQEDQNFNEICNNFITKTNLNEKEINYLYLLFLFLLSILFH